MQLFRKTKKSVWFWARFLVTALACGAVWWWVDWSQFVQKLRTADIVLLLVAFAIIHIDRVFMAWKWNILLRNLGLPISVGTATQGYYVGSFWSTFLPMSIGGDVVRVTWLMTRVQVGGAQIVSSVIVERLFGVLALAIAVLGSLVIGTIYADMSLKVVASSIAALLAGLIAILLAVFSAPAHRLMQSAIAWLPSQEWSRKIEEVRLAFLAYKERPRLLLAFLALSVLEQAFPIVGIIVLANAFRIDLPLVWAIIGIPLVLAGARMPISINGFGINEGLYAFVFSMAGIPVTESVLMALVDRALLLIAALPGAVLTVLASGQTTFSSSNSRPSRRSD